jgi:hypothetical protein
MTFLEHFADQSAGALLASTWHGLLILAVVWLALRLLPPMPAALRSLLWTAALVLIVALPFLPAPAADADTLLPTKAISLNPAWGYAIAAAWLGLSLVRALQLLVSAHRLRGVWAKATPVEVLSGALPATVCTSTEVARPSVIGFFAPRILIPASLYGTLSPEELEHIVLHEQEHLRRHDDWRNLGQKLAVVLFPLNPALLWVERRLCLERELACDESVLAQTSAPKSYASSLLHLAEASLFSRHISLALGAWERRSELARRIQLILAHRAPSRGSRTAAAILGAAMLAMAAGLAKTPDPITFTSATPAFTGFTANAASARRPVVFRSSAVRPNVMVDAVMHVPAASPQPGTLARPVHRTARRQRTRQYILAERPVRIAEAPRATYVVLNTADAGPDFYTQPVYRLVYSQPHPQAILPTSGGWLIIQM